MTTEVLFDLDNIDDRRRTGGVCLPYGHTHLNELQDCEPESLRKAMGVRDKYLDTPSGIGESLVDRMSIGAPVSQTAADWLPIVEELRQDTAKAIAFPHLAWESLKFGLQVENRINEKLNKHIDAIREKQVNISLLLDLSGEIGGLKEDGQELPPKALEILEQLKARGIDLRKENQSIEELKRQASSKESDLRSQMQIAFTTEVQRLMQQIESIHQILQNIIRSDAKVKEKANQLQK